jgi:hypothetical protein
MADSSQTIDQLEAELNAALGVLAPQIRGLDDYELLHLSGSAAASVRQENIDHKRRRDLINVVLEDLRKLEEDLGNLEFDGYPEVPTENVPSEVLEELNGVDSDIEAALATFNGPGPATGVTINLGAPSTKS